MAMDIEAIARRFSDINQENITKIEIYFIKY